MYGHQQPYASPHQTAYPAAAAYPPAYQQQGYPSPYGAASPHAANAAAMPTSAPDQAPRQQEPSPGQMEAQAGQAEGEQQRRKRFREFKEEKQVAAAL
jgi:hypothetical protein